jgi:hypothetical protein
MTNFDALLDLDGNGRPIYGDSPFKVTKDHTLVGSNATVVVPIFTLTGSVMLTRLWGVVTTNIGVNHTAASWRLNDQTAQVYLTAVGGTTLSAIKAGSVIVKDKLVAVALTKLDNAAGVVSETATAGIPVFSPVVLVKKTAATTQIEYRYATTDTPTTGAIRFYASYLPISDDGALTPA